MKIDIKQFRVRPGHKVRLKHWKSQVKPFYKTKDDYERLLQEHVAELSRLQQVFYAHHRYALLIIFQAMDAAGKDGAISHVMSGINPQGCEVFSFKQPSSQELDHDFLWRTNVCLPERGRIGIFNRSYYEEVLVVRVHPEFLQKEHLPTELLESEKKLWRGRYESIRGLERHLYRNGTRIIKFFLHVSKDEQCRRFVRRIEDPKRNWKLSIADLAERERWKDYMKAYEDCLEATSSDEAPWYVVPADDKPNARLIISQVILKTLDSLKLEYPEVTLEQQKRLKEMRKQLPC